MLPFHHCDAFAVNHVIGKTANLCTFSAVGASSFDGAAGMASSAVADAQSSVDETFQRHRYIVVNIADFFCGEFPCQYDLRETHSFQKLGFFNSACVALCAGMKLDRGDVKAKDAHILNNQGVGPDFIEFANETFHVFQLLFVKNRVDCHIYFSIEQVGKFNGARYFGNIVSGSCACSEF